MNTYLLSFADSVDSIEKAIFVLFGVPFDSTSSYRKGSKFAPNAIRDASYNFEAWMFEHQLDLSEVCLYDAGDLYELGSVEEMLSETKKTVREILDIGAFPIMLGGEHSVSPAAISQFKDIGVLHIDAHLDFRDEYMGCKNSHACASRRASDFVGIKNIVPMGMRSISKEEIEDVKKKGLRFIDAYKIHEIGIEIAVDQALKYMKNNKRIYLTLDIDGIDPAYAPGTGTPEPFGLTPFDIKKLIAKVADRLVGFDLVEVSPPYDNGNTSALAARIVKEVIAQVYKKNKNIGKK